MTSKGARSSQWVEATAGPTPAVHGVVRWRLIDLAQWVFDEYRISVTKQIRSGELRALGYRKLSARPRHHAHDEAVVAAFKKKVPDILATIAATRGKPLELWFQDEARIGQKNKVTRRWAERGTRPFALKDQRNRLRLYFRRHLSRARQGGRSRPPILQHRGHDAPPPGDRRRRRARAYAVLFVDRAGWHVTASWACPKTRRSSPFRPSHLELNPVENIWQYMRDNWLSNRIFANYNDILDHCCFNWNKLVERPWLIMSIGTRRWAHG